MTLSIAEGARRLGYDLGPHRTRAPKATAPEVPEGWIRNPLSGSVIRLPTPRECATTGGAARVVARTVVRPVVRTTARPAAPAALTTSQIAAALRTPLVLDPAARVRREAGELVAQRIRAAATAVQAEYRAQQAQALRLARGAAR